MAPTPPAKPASGPALTPPPAANPSQEGEQKFDPKVLARGRKDPELEKQGYKKHIVTSGQGIWQVARFLREHGHEVSYRKLLKWNKPHLQSKRPDADPNKITTYVGDVIYYKEEGPKVARAKPAGGDAEKAARVAAPAPASPKGAAPLDGQSFTRDVRVQGTLTTHNGGGNHVVQNREASSVGTPFGCTLKLKVDSSTGAILDKALSCHSRYNMSSGADGQNALGALNISAAALTLAVSQNALNDGDKLSGNLTVTMGEQK
jgi:hypothetical protein